MMAKLLWYLHRLASMAPKEIVARTRQQRLIRHERRNYGVYFVRPSIPNLADSVRRFRTEEDARFYFSWMEREQLSRRYREQFSENLCATIQEADALLQHEMVIFDRPVQLGQMIDWHRDPKTGVRWPNLYWTEIDIRDGTTIGGVKWTWELNRHHHLVTLAKAYFLTGNDQYAHEVCAQLAGWIDANRPGYGVNWTSSLELALRLINWTWALAFIRQAPVLTDTLFQTIMQFVELQAGYIGRHLSTHSSANNHLVGEATALAVVGMAFPWLAPASGWRSRGLALLERELPRQIYADGVPAEQAVEYLSFTLDFNRLAWRLAALNGCVVPRLWPQRLAASADFLSRIMDSAANVPLFGDGDDGVVVRLDDSPSAHRYFSLISSAHLLNDESRRDPYAVDETNAWIFGFDDPAPTVHKSPISSQQQGSQIYREGGYAVLRDEATVALFDVGPLGYLSTAAHGHADALSLWVSVNGSPILIDPGTYAYQEGGAWRTYFRSTTAHNTVCVDGKNQSDMLGTFLWGRRASARLVRWDSDTECDLAIGEQDGYARSHVMHRRAVSFMKPDWLIVRDHLLGTGRHQIMQSWHFPTGAEVAISGRQIRAKHGHAHIALAVQTDCEINIRLYCGEQNPICGWQSQRYGHIAPSPSVFIDGMHEVPLTICSVICLHPSEQDEVTFAAEANRLLAAAIRRESEHLP